MGADLYYMNKDYIAAHGQWIRANSTEIVKTLNEAADVICQHKIELFVICAGYRARAKALEVDKAFNAYQIKG